MASRRIRVAFVAFGLALLASGFASARELTFRDRVAAQRAIEQVYWNHRIWPEVNRGPKPPLDTLLPQDALSARVLRVLKVSEAITGEQLQAELERMTRTTRAPQVLRELFAALGNDPELIAETLARGTLAERLGSGESGTAAREREASFVGRVATAPPAGGYALPAIPAAVDALCHGENWQPTLTDLPSARSEAVAVWTGTEMIVWGGNSGKREDTGGRYNPATDTWTATALTPATPSIRIRSSAVWTGTEMIVWGGWTGQAPLATGGRYNPTTDTWTATSTGTGTPSARERNSAVWTGSELIIWGGYDASTNTYVNTGGRYAPASDTWMATATTAGNPTARREHTAVWTGSVMVVWGGYNGTAAVNTGSRYNPSTNTWAATVTSATAAARYLHTAVWTGSVMIIWGGYNGTTMLNTGSRYNPISNAWTATATTAGVPPAVYIHTAVWTGTEMIVWGGHNGSVQVNTGGRYNPTTNAWTATSISPTATARGEHSAVWTGSEMIVWGGTNGNPLATGSRYNPATDSWIATSTATDVPLARQLHTAVWTGAEMIVWGGLGSFSIELDTGGRYEPATNSWIATPTSGAPALRREHTAIWTGTELIVWGGFSQLGFLDTGGRFNPTTGTWAPMTASTGTVIGRYGHTAVWTGTELIVGGGSDTFQAPFFTNTGGRYDPAGDSWTATSTGSGVPGFRIRHTAIWTGSEMIVWGGDDNSVPFAAGGRYDPASNSWTAVSSAGEPSARRLHTAIWTGSRMVVWGGSPSSGTWFNTGGQYDPSTNSWAPTATSGAPSGRQQHSAIWTGDEMIVWGGHPAPGDGGRFRPATDSWAATTLIGAPPPRRSHPAVWTGDAMIVWGGYDGTGPLNSGGRYQQDTNGAACDDGDACTGADVCNGSTCQGQILTVPAEVTGLVAQSDDQTIAWNPATSAGPGTVHDVLRGESLPVGGGAEVCVSPGIAAAQTVDATTPPPGSGLWYLVRARNSCGFGSYGTRSNGAQRFSSACP